jgi:hypothetical protein
MGAGATPARTASPREGTLGTRPPLLPLYMEDVLGRQTLRLWTRHGGPHRELGCGRGHRRTVSSPASLSAHPISPITASWRNASSVPMSPLTKRDEPAGPSRRGGGRRVPASLPGTKGEGRPDGTADTRRSDYPTPRPATTGSLQDVSAGRARDTARLAASSCRRETRPACPSNRNRRTVSACAVWSRFRSGRTISRGVVGRERTAWRLPGGALCDQDGDPDLGSEVWSLGTRPALFLPSEIVRQWGRAGLPPLSAAR